MEDSPGKVAVASRVMGAVLAAPASRVVTERLASALGPGKSSPGFGENVHPQPSSNPAASHARPRRSFPPMPAGCHTRARPPRPGMHRLYNHTGHQDHGRRKLPKAALIDSISRYDCPAKTGAMLLGSTEEHQRTIAGGLHFPRTGHLDRSSPEPKSATIPTMSLIVQKFGGSSLADPEKIHRAARRAIRAKLDGRRVVLVVSAMGRTTNELLSLAKALSPRPPKRELDMLLTTGEQVSIALMAMAIDAAGHKAISLTAAQLGLFTDSAHTRARIQSISRERIDRELATGKIVIVAGFQGIDAGGEITTLGRGASDTTATALAALLGAEVCEIYTDVDGVHTADPRMVPQARKIDRISYDEMLELASAGAGVMHSRAIEFGKKFDVPVHVRSSMLEQKGTMIVAENPGMEAISVRGVTLKEDLCTISLTGVPNQRGVAGRIFSEIAGRNILVDDIVQSVYDKGRFAHLGFCVGSSDLEETRAVCATILRDLGIAGLEVDENISKVSIVGVGMRSHSGVAATMFKALAEHQINIENISTSEIVVSCTVRREEGAEALRVLHQAFELDKPDGGE